MKNNIFKLKKIHAFVFSVSLALFPLVSFAAGTGAGFQDLLETVGRFLGIILPMMIALEFIVFFVSVMRFYLMGDNSEAKVSGNKFVIWALSALFVTFGLLGIVAVLQNTVGVSSGGTITAPQLPEVFQDQ